ncbi:MAG: hypothetical protein PVJ28_02320 [Acidimicrobiia bacterium]
MVIALAVVVSACAADTAETTTTMAEAMGSHDGTPEPADVIAATLATSAFQDVDMAEAAGWGTTIDALGCFENEESGGMGLHYLNESLLDDTLDVAEPEALVYELDANGEIGGLVAHEYIVPVEAWTADEPPSVFGMELHQHPVLPLWVLHAWLWKQNPAGFFEDWNPAVRLCPEGVPIFGVDLP